MKQINLIEKVEGSEGKLISLTKEMEIKTVEEARKFKNDLKAIEQTIKEFRSHIRTKLTELKQNNKK